MTRKHRRHSTARKREVVEAYLNGASMRGLSQKFDVCRTLIPIWIDKYERGEFDDAVEEELIPEYEARIAALERLVGRQALEIEVSQRGIISGLIGAHCRREARLGPSSPAHRHLDQTGVRVDGPATLQFLCRSHASRRGPGRGTGQIDLRDIPELRLP